MSVKWWRNLGDVQSNISGDIMVASGGERHVDTRDAQDLLARILFSGSWRACISTTESSYRNLEVGGCDGDIKSCSKSNNHLS